MLAGCMERSCTDTNSSYLRFSAAVQSKIGGGGDALGIELSYNGLPGHELGRGIRMYSQVDFRELQKVWKHSSLCRSRKSNFTELSLNPNFCAAWVVNAFQLHIVIASVVFKTPA